MNQQVLILGQRIPLSALAFDTQVLIAVDGEAGFDLAALVSTDGALAFDTMISVLEVVPELTVLPRKNRVFSVPSSLLQGKVFKR